MTGTRIESKPQAPLYAHPLFPVKRSISNKCSDHLGIGSHEQYNIPVGNYDVRAQGNKYSGDGYRDFDAKSFDEKKAVYVKESDAEYEARLKHEANVISKMFNTKDIFCLQKCPPPKESKQSGFHFFYDLRKKLFDTYSTDFAYTSQPHHILPNEQLTKCIFFNTAKYTIDERASQALNVELSRLYRKKTDFCKELFACVLIENDTGKKISIINIDGHSKVPHLNSQIKLMGNIEKAALKVSDDCILAGSFNAPVLNKIPTNVHTIASTEQQFSAREAIYAATKSQSFTRIDHEIYSPLGYLYEPKKESKESAAASKNNDGIIQFASYLTDNPLSGDAISESNKLTTVALEKNITRFSHLSGQENKDIIVEKQMQVSPPEQFGKRTRLAIQSHAVTPIYYYEFLLAKKVPGISKVIQGKTRKYFFDLSSEIIQKVIDPLKPENTFKFTEFLNQHPKFCTETVLESDSTALIDNYSSLVMEEERLNNIIAVKQTWHDQEKGRWLNSAELEEDKVAAKSRLHLATEHKNYLLITSEMPENPQRKAKADRLFHEGRALKKLHDETKDSDQKSAVAKKLSLNRAAQNILRVEEIAELESTNPAVKKAYEQLYQEKNALLAIETELKRRADIARERVRPFSEEIAKMNDSLKAIALDAKEYEITQEKLKELKTNPLNLDKLIQYCIPGAIPDYKKNIMLELKSHINILEKERSCPKQVEKLRHFKELLTQFAFLDLSNYQAIKEFRSKYLILEKDNLVLAHRGRYKIPGFFFSGSKSTSEKLLMRVLEFTLNTFNRLHNETLITGKQSETHRRFVSSGRI